MAKIWTKCPFLGYNESTYINVKEKEKEK